MRSRHKNTKTSYDFLAFFNVVASRQISPHFLFGRQRYRKNLICKSFCNKYLIYYLSGLKTAIKFHNIVKKSYLRPIKILLTTIKPL